jgi:hypothetical protein
MTKRKPQPDNDLPDNSIGCIRTVLFVVLVEAGIAAFIWFLISLQ